MSLFKFQAIFREYLLINKKSICSKELFLNSSWPKPNFLPSLKYVLAQHLVETQICTLSKIFWVKKLTLKVGTSPYDCKPSTPPPLGQQFQSRCTRKYCARAMEATYLIYLDVFSYLPHNICKILRTQMSIPQSQHIPLTYH